MRTVPVRARLRERAKERPLHHEDDDAKAHDNREDDDTSRDDDAPRDHTRDDDGAAADRDLDNADDDVSADDDSDHDQHNSDDDNDDRRLAVGRGGLVAGTVERHEADFVSSCREHDGR